MSDIKNNSINSSQEHTIRVEKMNAMRQQGVEPWPESKEVTSCCADAIASFDDTNIEEQISRSVAGRIVSIREHGKAAFVVIQDRTGQFQLYIKQDLIGEKLFDFFKHSIDLGDIIWAEGTLFRTKMGQVTLKVTDLTLLSKCLYPLPEKFHGLVDIEVKYRQRYLDLIATQESRERFKKRSAIVRFIRSFLEEHQFIEVETPMLHPIAGGAAARPFVTHHNALDMQLFMRIAPELYLKRLVVGGFERVYEINRNFRNEGISTRHNPEFTMLEFYIAYKDVFWMMNFVENLLKSLASHLSETMSFSFGNENIDFTAPFVRMTMHESVMQYADCSAQDLLPKSIDAVMKKYGVSVAGPHSALGHKILALFEVLVEPHLVQPTFIYGFPIEISPLAKRNPKTGLADRFELFIGRMELSNAFSELNDPFDQAARFKEQVEHREGGDNEAHEYDADYVHALEYGLPPTAGCGIGIDRLVMVLTNTTSIKDVILFPTLKKQK